MSAFARSLEGLSESLHSCNGGPARSLPQCQKAAEIFTLHSGPVAAISACIGEQHLREPGRGSERHHGLERSNAIEERVYPSSDRTGRDCPAVVESHGRSLPGPARSSASACCRQSCKRRKRIPS